MKRIVIIVSLVFLALFPGKSEAGWYRGCWHARGYWGPRAVVVVHPCARVWIPGYWGWNCRFHRRYWVGRYWRY